MSRYCGKIGFGIPTETSPGIWEQSNVVERTYYGDLIRNYRRLDSSEKVNDDISFNNQISIVADAFANRNIINMLYAEFMGTKWTITSVEVQEHRLILSLGGIYNNVS